MVETTINKICCIYCKGELTNKREKQLNYHKSCKKAMDTPIGDFTTFKDWLTSLDLLYKPDYTVNVASRVMKSKECLIMRFHDTLWRRIFFLSHTVDQLTELKELVFADFAEWSDENSIDFVRPVIPDSIGNLINLQKLDLSGNYLTSVPESIRKLVHLKELKLERNEFVEFPDSFISLVNLELLNLTYNKLKLISPMIGKFESLKTLHLAHNQLSELPESIGELKNLEMLDLHRNQLESLPDSISKLENLVQLHLNWNNLFELPDSISKLKNLARLNLNSNEIVYFPETGKNLKNLVTLDLSYNELTEVPDFVTELPNLQRLNIRRNPIEYLPESFNNLKKLTFLELGGRAEGGTKIKLKENINSIRELSDELEIRINGASFKLGVIKENLKKGWDITSHEARWKNDLFRMPKGAVFIGNGVNDCCNNWTIEGIY